MSNGRKLTYVDSDVLRAAFKGNQDISSAAWKILDDSSRSFVSSVFLELELLPKPCCFKKTDERTFLEFFFARADTHIEASEQLARLALEEAKRIGLAAMDALHVASAAQAGAIELVTGELETKPIFRTRLVKVISLRAGRS